jgi:hypothetical protein
MVANEGSEEPYKIASFTVHGHYRMAIGSWVLRLAIKVTMRLWACMRAFPRSWFSLLVVHEFARSGLAAEAYGFAFAWNCNSTLVDALATGTYREWRTTRALWVGCRT